MSPIICVTRSTAFRETSAAVADDAAPSDAVFATLAAVEAISSTPAFDCSTADAFDSASDATWSMDVGSVRLTERYLRHDPPTPDETAAATAAVDAALDEALTHVPVAAVRALVGLAGSVTTVTAHALDLDRYDSTRIDGAVLGVDQVLCACDDLLHRTRAERAALGFMHPGRVDIIGAGALVWSRVVRRVAAASGLTEVVTSEHDILDGIALSLV